MEEKGYCKKIGKLLVDVDSQFFSSVDVELLWSDCTKAEKELGWQRKISFPELVKMMVVADMELAINDEPGLARHCKGRYWYYITSWPGQRLGPLLW